MEPELSNNTEPLPLSDEQPPDEQPPAEQPFSIEKVLALQPKYVPQQPEKIKNDFIDDDDDRDDDAGIGQEGLENPDGVILEDSDDERVQRDQQKIDREVAELERFMMDSDSEADTNVDPLLRGRKRPRDLGPSRKKRKLGKSGSGVQIPHEIKIALSNATDALMHGELNEAFDIVQEIIRQNGEIHEAWMLLSTIFQHRQQTDQAITAMLFAMKMKPRDFHGWIACAQFCLSDETEGARQRNVERAQLCYSGAISAKPKSLKARMGMADCALESGSVGLAARAYNKILMKRPYNLRALRNLTEAAFDTRKPRPYIEKACAHYEKVIVHVRGGGQLQRGEFEWSDITIYCDMLSWLGRHADAVRALRSLTRLMIGREEETFWDAYIDDDREFDQDEVRRSESAQYVPNKYPQDLYGPALQLDIRVKLAIYRLKLGHVEEAMRHLNTWIPLTGPVATQIHEYFEDGPSVIKNLASELLDSRLFEQSLSYYEFYEALQFGDIDPEVLIQKGRCYLELDDRTTAEDLFIQALEADDDNIEARYELAQLYEKYHEVEAGFALVNEAIRFAEIEDQEDKLDEDWNEGIYDNLSDEEIRALHRRRVRRKILREKSMNKKRRGTRRPYVRRFMAQAKREAYEREKTESFRVQYQKVQDLRTRMAEGDIEIEEEWMAAAGELVDDFRSFKELYPWDKYLAYLGHGSFFRENKPKPKPDVSQADEQGDGENEGRATREGTRAGTVAPQGREELVAIAERLQQQLEREPREAEVEPQQHDHRGIPFDQWLDLFLEYAIYLARKQRAEEAYIVCQSARDSVVYKSSDSSFAIHVAWAACAIYAADEETCVAIARYFMRHCHASTDSYRIFSALCRTCQSPVSWYASGPAQKYILRQIKAMDRTLLPPALAEAAMSLWDTAVPRDEADAARHENLDVALLMLYGHILLTSTSYTYALNYFLRAAALDPTNPMINLSIGIAYVHYAMKRQADNRQFIIAQGMSYIFMYHNSRRESPDITERLEADYNVARCYHLLGLYHLAAEFYARVLKGATAWRRWMEECEEKAGPLREFVIESAVNMRTYSLTNGDYNAARAITEEWLVL